MKRVCLILLFLCLAMLITSVPAKESFPLGKGNVALKLGYINFTTDRFDDSGGVYFGIEGYGKISSRLYLGGEVGASDTGGGMYSDSVELQFYELNLKYIIKNTSQLVLDTGAGISYNDVNLTYQQLFGGDVEHNDSLIGLQFFADVIYKMNWFDIGFNAKYQITESTDDTSRWGKVKLNNLRLGVQIGMPF